MKIGKALSKVAISLLLISILVFVTLQNTDISAVSTEAVIIGPIVGLDDLTITDSTTTADYSSANLSVSTPYSSGALRSYTSLGVYNIKRDITYGDYTYLGFVRYFNIYRSDGRPIYDDDGILDVSSSATSLASEIVNYPAYISALTTTLPTSTVILSTRQARFQDGVLYTNYYSGSSKTGYQSYSLPTNPSDTRITISTLIDSNGNLTYSNATSIAMEVSVTGYYKNMTWGGTGDYTSINQNMTNYIAVSNRDWSNTLSASGTGVNSGTYQNSTIYYSPITFTAIASNLNNYIKINGVQATPSYGTSVVPYADGHYITISNNGLTTIQIENGAEEVYTTYYCMIDNTLPDVSFVYHNSNATDNRQVFSTTTSSTGAKTQTISEGVFKDQVQVNFSADLSTESPESAYYIYDGKQYAISSGTTLSNEGSYTLYVYDEAGNTTISTFIIDSSSPTTNYLKLVNDTNYLVNTWYVTTFPYSYASSSSYSFSTYTSALNYAVEIEQLNQLTTYYLGNINDFVDTHLVAVGDTPKVGEYYYYKSLQDPDLYVYYFNEDLLNYAINLYASEFVSDMQTYNLSYAYYNNYGNYKDSSMYYNLIDNAFIINSFTFTTSDNNESYKIYYDYVDDGVENYKELAYNISFASQVNMHGLYKIKEIDYAGNEIIYYVFLDLLSPMIEFEAMIYGSSSFVTQTISTNDIPVTNNLIFYYEDFVITDVIEDDTYWTMEIKLPDNTIMRYINGDTIPYFSSFGSGEFVVTISDRVGNNFTFTVMILGNAPVVEFNSIDNNSKLEILISSGENYNTLLKLEIYKNDVLLSEDDELTTINIDSLYYLFDKGGIYTVVLTDNFGRVLSYEYKFEKDLPTGLLLGVEHNGKTNTDVQFIYDYTKYFVTITVNGNNYIFDEVYNDNLSTITFTSLIESNDLYSIRLINKEDLENYNIYNFTIKTISPIINLYGVEDSGTTGGIVYATWETIDEELTATYFYNSVYYDYRSGQTLSSEGYYEIVLKDTIGNFAFVSFYIDKSVDYSIVDFNSFEYLSSEITFINFDIKLLSNEDLAIEMTKDNEQFYYDFGLFLTEEGYYTALIKDVFDNSFYFTFTIDKTPPVAELFGVEDFGKTNGGVWATSLEGGLSSWIVYNGITVMDYVLGTELTLNGNYVLYIQDNAKNTTTFTFEIDNQIDYDINVYSGGISNGEVKIVAYENLTIVMLKDGVSFEYNFEDILYEEGEYSYTIVDDLGNLTSNFFYIINKNKQNLTHILQENISVQSVVFDNGNYVDYDYEFILVDGNLYLHEEGLYVVSIIDENTNKTYSFVLTIDTTAPTLELVNVEDGGSTTSNVIMRNLSETPCDIYVWVDGMRYEYTINDEIEKSGSFIVILVDEAGNQTQYTFEKIYTFNGAAIGVLVGLGVIAVVALCFLIKNRRKVYVGDIIEEEIEEIEITENYTDDENNGTE